MKEKTDSLLILVALIVVSFAIGAAIKKVYKQPNFSICPLCNQVTK